MDEALPGAASPAADALAVAAPAAGDERYAYGAALALPAAPGARWTVEVPDLADCRSEGDGAAECIANIVDAVEAWVSAARQRGEALPPPTPLDTLARQPGLTRRLWLLIVRRDAPDDLQVSKALADAGTLPSLDALTTDTPAPGADPRAGASS